MWRELEEEDIFIIHSEHALSLFIPFSDISAFESKDLGPRQDVLMAGKLVS